MNQEMTRLLTERLGLTDEEYGALQAGDPSRLFAGRFAERFSDPLLATMFNSMFQQNSNAREDHVDDDQALDRAKMTIRKLKENLAAADTMARYIAEVFGACPQCWGLNRLCLQCKGSGKPGSGEPQEQELMSWVGPALTKLGMKVTEIENRDIEKEVFTHAVYQTD
ncbi:MAG: hypothetical protein L0Z46_12565 [Nitrospiraceae bacterium]|nr:hypothetical protein [Nitrospiraceae bacterium]